jgi:hypothetical protein
MAARHVMTSRDLFLANAKPLRSEAGLAWLGGLYFGIKSACKITTTLGD